MVVGVLGVGEGTGASPMKHTWLGWWPAISEIEGSVGQEIDVVGPQQTTHPMIAPNNRAAPTPLPSAPPSHAKKNHAPRCAKRGFCFVPRTGFEPVLPA